jgi:hypothetical protein
MMKKYKNIDLLYEEIIEHPENVFVHGYDINSIIEILVGDIKSKPFCSEIKERIIIKKNLIPNILNETIFKWGWEQGTLERDYLLEELCEDIIQKYYPDSDVYYNEKYSI